MLSSTFFRRDSKVSLKLLLKTGFEGEEVSGWSCLAELKCLSAGYPISGDSNSNTLPRLKLHRKQVSGSFKSNIVCLFCSNFLREL